MGYFEDKLAEKRAEAKEAQEKAQKEKELASAAKDAARNYASPARREEAVRRYQELRSPSVPAARPAAAQSPAPPAEKAATVALPFFCSVTSNGIAISGGYYMEGAAGSPIPISGISGAGDYAYLVITQDSDGDVTNVELDVSGEKDSTELGGSSPNQYVSKSNVLLGTRSSGTTPVVTPIRTGNFILTTWAINGYAAKWAETIGSTI